MDYLKRVEIVLVSRYLWRKDVGVCERLTITDGPEIRELLADLGINYDDYEPFLPLINSGPTENIPIIFGNEDNRRIELAIWWYKLKLSTNRFVPEIRCKTFNARAQKLEDIRLYQNAFRTQRCVIPASGFYGYKSVHGMRYPYYIKPKEKAIGFAGLYNRWNNGHESTYSCTLVTTDPHPRLAHIHDKSFPVMLTRDYAESWLDPEITDICGFNRAFNPKLRSDFVVIPVSHSAAENKNKGLECLTAVGEPELILKDRQWKN